VNIEFFWIHLLFKMIGVYLLKFLSNEHFKKSVNILLLFNCYEIHFISFPWMFGEIKVQAHIVPLSNKAVL
jgi:hypothetical protein